MGAKAKAAKASDIESVFLRVTPNGLVPFSGYDAEHMAKYRIGDVVEAVLHVPQSEKQYRLLRTILTVVADNTDFPSGDALLHYIKLKLGHYDSVTLHGGGALLHPKSMKRLDRAGLNDFFNRAMDIIATDILPGLNVPALILEKRILIGDHSCPPRSSSAPLLLSAPSSPSSASS